jgi:hypothetical protein
MANSAPTIGNLTSTVTFDENAVSGAPQIIDASVTFADPDNNFNGGALTVSGLLAEDTVAIRNVGTAAGEIGISGSNVTFGGTIIGTFAGGAGATLSVTFNASATSAAIEALVENLTYANSSDDPAASRTLQIKISDAAGVAAIPALTFTERTGAANPFDGIDVGDFGAPTFGDLDGDGDLDAVVGDNDGFIHYFRNNGSAILPNFTELTGVSNPFGALNFFGLSTNPALVDLDGDGDLDLAVGSGNGDISYFRNNGSAANPDFSDQAGVVNPFNGIVVGIVSAPVFVDLDGDGDRDIIVGDVSGDLHYFQNIGSAIAPAFATAVVNPFGLADVGDFSMPSFADLDHDGDFDIIVGEQDGNLNYFENTGSAKAPVFAAGVANPFASTDVGFLSVPSFADLDGDGDLDAIVGEDNGTLNYIENTTPKPAAPDFVQQTGADNPLDTIHVGRIYSLPTFADLDGDGDLDAIVGEGDGNLNYFENTGSAVAPVFAAAVVNPFGLTKMSNFSAPVFADLDGDGDLDAIVGHALGTLKYFENTGSAVAPAFAALVTDPFGLSDVGDGSTPSFVDLDGDGDLDTIVGEENGNLIYFENTGSATAPAFAAGVSNPFGLTNVAFEIAPSFADFDGDGDFDAIVGKPDGTLSYFENTGSATAPAFTERTGAANPFNGIDVGLYSKPSFADLDGDGDLDVIVGGNFGNLSYFKNTGAGFVLNVNVTAQNDAPVNTVPGAQIAAPDTATAIAGLSINDADAGSGNLTTTLGVAHGTITATGTGVSGSGTATLTIVGTLTQINAALATVAYTGGLNYFGPDTLSMTTDDGGNAGGSAQSDTDQVAIQVGTVLTLPPGDNAYTAPAGPVQVNAGYGTDTATFGFKLTEATITYAGTKVIIDGPGSAYAVLSGFEKYVFTDGAVNNADGKELVDDLFYFSRNHDVWNAGMDADAHYEQYGWRELRDPNEFFSTVIYLSEHPELKGGDVSPVTHFHETGWKSGIAPSLNFDPAAYLDANPDVKAAGLDPLAHFLYWGRQEQSRQAIAPTEIIAANGFDYVWYLQHNPDVAAAKVDPLLHFQIDGWKEGRDPNALFDTSGYLATYTDVAAAGVNPLEHYNIYGWKEGRDPSVDFDTTDYLATYTDVAAAHINPLTHYLYYGQHEGRSAHADSLWG